MSGYSSIKKEDVVTIDELDCLRQKFCTMVQLKIFHPEFLHVVEELLEREKRWMEKQKRMEERRPFHKYSNKIGNQTLLLDETVLFLRNCT